MKAKQLYIGSILTLFAGGLIYLLFRTSGLRMFGWCERLGIKNLLIFIRKNTLKLSHILPDWFFYSLPDALWIFSYVSLILYVWKNNINKQNIFWLLLLPSIALLSELGQKFGLVSGTFDSTDLIGFALGTVTPFILFKNSITFNDTTA